MQNYEEYQQVGLRLITFKCREFKKAVSVFSLTLLLTIVSKLLTVVLIVVIHSL